MIEMLLGVPVPAGFVDRAAGRLEEKLSVAGFDEAIKAALAGLPGAGRR